MHRVRRNLSSSGGFGAAADQRDRGYQTRHRGADCFRVAAFPVDADGRCVLGIPGRDGLRRGAAGRVGCDAMAGVAPAKSPAGGKHRAADARRAARDSPCPQDRCVRVEWTTFRKCSNFFDAIGPPPSSSKPFGNCRGRWGEGASFADFGHFGRTGDCASAPAQSAACFPGAPNDTAVTTPCQAGRG